MKSLENPSTADTSHHKCRVPQLVGLWWRVLKVAYLRFGFSAGYIFAAAIALYAVVCLAPMGILLAAGLRTVLGSGSAAYAWLQLTAQQLGGQSAEQIMTQVDGLLANPDVHVASLASVVILVWASLRLFDTLERSMTDVWPGRVLRDYFRRKLVSLVSMLVAGLLLTVFVLVNAFLATARAWLQQFPEIDPAALAMLRPPLLLAVQFILSVIAFTLIYRYLPLQSIPWRVAAGGGIFAAVLWHAVSPIFTCMMTRSQLYGASYGGLAGVVVFSLWALLGAWVLLLGAHFAAAHDHVFVQRKPPSEDDSVIGWPGRLHQEGRPHREGE